MINQLIVRFVFYGEMVSKIQVPAARNTLRILALLSSIDVPISAARIRTELDLPRSTTYHLLAELETSGFVVHLPENQTYGLGLAAYSMASAYTTQQPLVRMAQKPLVEAASLVDGSGHLARLSGSETLYLSEVRSEQAVSLITEVGVRLSAARTASGRIMLAHLPQAEAKAALSSSGLEKSWREIKERLELFRRRGWAEEIEEVSRGQRSVAVAIVDHLQRPAASLAVTYRADLADSDEAVDVAIAVLMKSAKSISKRMYGTKVDAQLESERLG